MNSRHIAVSLLFVVIPALLLFALGTVRSLTSSAYDNYPEKWKHQPLGAIADDWGYFNRYCTSWAAWSLHYKNGFNVPRGLGNAEHWGQRARERGYPVDMHPARGSVAWWDGSKSMGQHGHVAWVESVVGDYVTVLAYNVPNGSGAFNRRTLPKMSVSGYIHFKDLTGGHDVNGDKRADLVIAGTANTGSGRLEAHALDGSDKYNDWLFNTPTAAGYTDASVKLLMGDANGDSRSDMVLAATGPTGSGRLEAHVLDGANRFGSWQTNVATAAGYGNPSLRYAAGDVNGDGKADLAIIAAGPTGSGRLEAHVLNAATRYTSWLGNWATAAGYINADSQVLMGDVNGDKKADLVIVGTANTGSGRLEAHVLDGATSFSTWLAHSATPAGYISPSDRVTMGDVSGDGRVDLAIVGTGPTLSGTIEAHVLDGASYFNSWHLQVPTAAGYARPSDIILMGG